uniref:Uncharacterized protein n=1 Tax=Meloidogyne enterolobii TaxID=390850 RepID=A0A6V7UAW5_MELEN|nr:unnamed protein product [Meloidogyne enterolobii]
MPASLVSWNKTEEDNLVIQNEMLRNNTSVIEGQIISTDNTTPIPEDILVSISKNVGGDVELIPTEDDRSLALDTVAVAFPGVVSLEFKHSSGGYQQLRYIFKIFFWVL